LKILSRITSPTKGTIKVKGRIASLLEVGTGFNSELTGRENIFLNGSILGMKSKAIEKKFNEIVDFSGIEKFIDTPVKRYSSGMYVRLAFAVAAHIDADIMILDEILAVGDAEFQKKCLGKMDDVAKNYGRTILFVSHNISQVKNLCRTGILLDNGKVNLIGNINEVANRYFKHNMNNNIIDMTNSKPAYYSGSLDIINLELVNSINNEFAVNFDDPMIMKIRYKINREVKNMFFSITFSSMEMVTLCNIPSYTSGMINKLPGIYECSVKINHLFRAGTYSIHIGADMDYKCIWWGAFVGNIEILPLGKTKYDDKRSGILNMEYEWSFSE
jgi:lipopolysaccharide transport system ATP-binding protein